MKIAPSSASDTAKFRKCSSTWVNGMMPFSTWPTAAMAAPTTSDTSSMKPSDTTRVRLVSRALISRVTELPSGLARQMAFSAVCISPNTPLAVTISDTTPMMVASWPERWLEALPMAVCRKAAACSPIASCSLPISAPRAASSPNTSPATATMISSTGPMEVMA